MSNLLASFAVSTLPYTHIASCWEHAEKPVSIQEWFKGRDVLILGNCEVARSAIDNVNRAILKAAAVEVLNGPETRTSSTWFFLDEISESGKHEILIPLAKKGRSKGAKLFLAVQSIAGLRNPKLYGPELTDDLLGQIGTKFIGRMECLQTAEYLSKLLGESRQMQASYSYTSGEKPTSTTSYSEQVRKNVLPSTLMNLTMANDENGITGYVMSPRYGAFKTHLEGKELFEKTVYPIDENVRPFIPRPFHQQILRPWNKEEVIKFGVDIEKPFELKGFLKSAESGLPKELPKLADDPLNSLFH